MDSLYDVLIVGGGPAGLSAALNLGRARKRVLLCDAGPRRNAAAEHVHGFVTRDGTPPAELRRIGRQQLEPYSNVEAREVHVEAIHGERGAFEARLPTGTIQTRRVLLCTGMIDVLPPIEGFEALWGKAIFQCPYCHAWEIQNRRFAALALSVEMLDFAMLLRGWTSQVVALTDGKFAVPPEVSARLGRGGVRLDERRISRLCARQDELEQIEFVEGDPLPLDFLFARHPQQHVGMVQSLGLTLDPLGYLAVHEPHRETSRPGIYAAGDLLSPMQSAILAAASGMQAAATLNHELTAELATSGGLP